MSLVKQYLKVAVTDPYVTFRYLYSGKTSVKIVCLRRLTGSSTFTIKKYYLELNEQTDFLKYVENSLAEAGGNFYGQIGGPSELYALCRLIKPDVVIETGVASGVSSAFILKSLYENEKGTLYSIDMPNYEEVLVKKLPGYLPRPISIIPKNKQPGWVIPSKLKERWNLTIGLSSDILPSILARVKKVDIFLHDSEHTYENMMFEYKAAWPFIRNGGVLLSDNVSSNKAFEDFARSFRRKPVYVYFTGMGGLTKKDNGISVTNHVSKI